MPIDVYINTDEWKARRYPLILLVLLIAATLVGLVYLGRALTPEGGKVLTWSEWQVLLARRAYDRELAELEKDVAELVELVNRPADPVRAQIVCGRISAHTDEGEVSLVQVRAQIAAAAETVQQWAVGALSRDDALIAVDAAVQALRQLSNTIEDAP